MYNLISKIFDKLERGLSPRDKAIIVSLMLIISVLGIVLAVRYYNYIQKNPEFCNSCHLMEEAYTAWKLSGHRNIVCQDCHQLGMIEQNRLLVKFVFTTNRKTPEPHGNETPWKTCTKCHWDEAAQGSLTVNKSTGHARHVFMEKLHCKDCHSNGRCIRSGRRRTPVFAAIRIGRSTGSGWRISPASGAMPFRPKNRKRSSRTGSDACPVTGSRRKQHSRTGCRWRGSTAMSATSRMHASSRRTRTVSDVTRAKCCMLKPVHDSTRHCASCHVPHRWTSASR